MIADLDAIHATDVMPGCYPHLRLAGDIVCVIEERADGQESISRQIDQSRPDAQGYYAIGAYGWPWQRAADPQSGR